MERPPPVLAPSGATWVIDTADASYLRTRLEGNGRPIFALQAPPIASIIGEDTSGTLWGRPVVVDQRIPGRTALVGDVSRAMLFHRRQNLVAESNRDAGFGLDETLLRFGWRFDVLLAEPGRVRKFDTEPSPVFRLRSSAWNTTGGGGRLVSFLASRLRW